MKLLAWLSLFAASSLGQELHLLGQEPFSLELGRASSLELSLAAADVTGARLGPLPSVSGLDVSVAPPVFEQSLAEGSHPTNVRWTIRVVGHQIGRHELPQFSVLLGTRTLKSTRREVEVKEDPAGARWAFIELIPERARLYAGELLEVRVLFGLDREFMDNQVTQLSGARLEFPARVSAPWISSVPGAEPVQVPEDPDASQRTFALNDDIARARLLDVRTVSGRAFRTLEHALTYRVREVGRWTLPSPLMQFAYATRFEEDFETGRRPLDLQEAFAVGNVLQLEVEAVPDANRPREFSGAIGQFSVDAEIPKPPTRVGEPFQVHLWIEGKGNLFEFDPPLQDLGGNVSLRGLLSGRDGNRRRITYECVLDAKSATFPSLTLAYFDSTPPGEYRLARTRPLPLPLLESTPPETSVPKGPAPSREATGDEDILGLLSMDALGNVEPASLPGFISFALAALTPWVFALALRTWLQRRSSANARALTRRARRARARCFRRVAREPNAMEQAFMGYLADRLGLDVPAVVGPDLPSLLLERGVSNALAAHADTTMEDLIARRYGGLTEVPPAQEILELVDSLEEELREREGLL